MHTAQLNTLSYRVIGAALAVHRELGPGLDERDYEWAFSTELMRMDIHHVCQKRLPIIYKEQRLDAGFRIDALVESELIVELKVVEQVHPIHEAQLLTYLRLSGLKLGLLFNFDVPLLKQGIYRKVMDLDEDDSCTSRSPKSIELPASCDDPENITYKVIAAAMEVHRHLGIGLLRSAYVACLCHEFSQREIAFERNRQLPVRYHSIELPVPAGIDIIVAGELPLTVVCTSEISPLLEARLLGKMKLGGWLEGLVLNFGDSALSSGIRRLFNPNAKSMPSRR